MQQVSKNNKSRRTRSRLGHENPKKGINKAYRSARKLSRRQNILLLIGVYRSTNTSKNSLKKLSLLPYEAGVFIVGFPPTKPYDQSIKNYNLVAHFRF